MQDSRLIYTQYLQNFFDSDIVKGTPSVDLTANLLDLLKALPGDSAIKRLTDILTHNSDQLSRLEEKFIEPHTMGRFIEIFDDPKTAPFDLFTSKTLGYAMVSERSEPLTDFTPQEISFALVCTRFMADHYKEYQAAEAQASATRAEQTEQQRQSYLDSHLHLQNRGINRAIAQNALQWTIDNYQKAAYYAAKAEFKDLSLTQQSHIAGIVHMNHMYQALSFALEGQDHAKRSIINTFIKHQSKIISSLVCYIHDASDIAGGLASQLIQPEASTLADSMAQEAAAPVPKQDLLYNSAMIPVDAAIALDKGFGIDDLDVNTVFNAHLNLRRNLPKVEIPGIHQQVNLLGFFAMYLATMDNYRADAEALLK